MDKFIFVFIIVGCVAASQGIDVSNYEISRNKLGSFGIKDVLNYIIGGGHGYYPGNYPGNYPSGPGGHYPSGPGGHYPSGPGGHYPSGSGNYPSGSGYYPGGGNYGPPGPPGAHAGCPLCDSSVYSYCSRKEAHDACCCSGGSYGYGGGCNKDCSFIYANTCQEFNLISSCCCVDVKSVGVPVVAAPIA